MAKTQRSKQEIEIEGRKLSVTNIEKPLYPNGFTKGQVIDYYIRVSKWLLPHFYNRPVTLKRMPDGVGGQAFYEKEAPKFTPEWVTRSTVPKRAGGEIHYILVNDLPTLVWCANAASIELHPFLHVAPDINRPTAVVFDLDPGPGTDILTCAELAFRLRERLDVQAFPKVSGSKGLQIYIPLNTPVTYDETQKFARELAESMARDYPDEVVANMAKEKRHGKIFIDWSQNSDFKTTVGVYSLRAKTDQPFVSMPVSWEELRTACEQKDRRSLFFTPEAALERLAEVGDLYQPVLELKQSLRASRSRAPLKFIEPMQAKPVAQLPEGTEWQYELKLDGYRALAIKDAGQVKLLSRRNNSYNTKFAPVVDALDDIEDGIILDGEIVALDEQGRPAFNVLQHYRPGSWPLVFYVFDLLARNGRDLRSQPLHERRRLLEQVITPNEHVRISAVLSASASAVIEAVRRQGLEGIVAKDVNSRYESGERSGGWVKFKTNRGQELVVGGYRKGGKSGFDNLAVGYYEGKKLIFIAKLKNGFTPQTKQELFDRMQKLRSAKCPFANLPEPKNARRGEALTAEAMKKYCWIKPELVVQAEFTDWTSANHLRHSRFVGIRDDKDPRSVVHEVPD